jgi:spermidine/putrescine ABC transporter ATP-binding subunit
MDNQATRKITGATVRLENLTKRFGDVVAVDAINLEIRAGEFLTLLGPSGSGKTTTLLMVAGFQLPTQGEIYIDDQPMVYTPPNKRNLGMVFQHYALFPHMTVFENIAFPLKMRKLPKAETRDRVKEVLEIVRLPGFEHRYPRQLSGGQQQRVALARCIVFNPRVLLMDEPLGALDKKLREEMQLEIKRIQEELGITVVYVTHDQEEALTMSDRIAVMNHGCIEQLGEPTELYEQPINLFVADFIGESNLLKGPVVNVADGVCTLALTDSVLVQAPAIGEMKPGEEIYLVIRPERPRFITDKTLFPNIIEGTVEAVIYVGESTKYEIRVQGHEPFFVVKRPNIVGDKRYHRGDQVIIGWTREDGIMLRP